MISAAQILAVWLTPAVWLQMAAVILDRGPDGLWIGLVLTLAPLIALGAGARPAELIRGQREPLFPVVVLLLTVGMLLWANIGFAGDVAAWLGMRRWHGIAAAAAAGWLLTGWRGARRVVPVLLLGSLLAVSVPLVELARTTAAGPLSAWERVAAQPAFRFPPLSPWVTTGRDLALLHGRSPMAFDEEHRIGAPAGGMLHARTRDGNRIVDIERELSPGQVVTLRPGDQLQGTSALRVRFEADKRVPGAPVSGIAWAVGQAPDWPRRAGLLLTLLLGGVALLRSGVAVDVSRRTVALAGAGLLAGFGWAQGWAIYSGLGAPDLFLGGVTAERLLDLQTLQPNTGPWRWTLQGLLLAGGLAGFVASSIALRERLGALDRTGGGEIGHDVGLWAAVFSVAGLASLWPIDHWLLILLALGGAASSLGPAALWPPAPDLPRVATLAGLVGLAVFVTLAATAHLRGPSQALLAAAGAYPALAAVPAGAAVLWISRWASRA